MATPKRKRTAKRPSTRKRPKYSDSSDTEQPSGGDFWEAESILQEKRTGRKLLYLIQWKGVDPATGDEYLPTWEPEEHPTADLVAVWQQEKAARASTNTSGRAQSSRVRERPKKQGRLYLHLSRSSRIVQSSPESSTAAPSTSAISQPSTPTRASAVPKLSSSTVTTPIGAPAPSKHGSPRIRIGHRGDSFDPNEYERFSQLATSQPASLEPRTQGTDIDSSQLFAAVPEYWSSGVVPDSQSSTGEGDFAPATQQTTGTTQQSSSVTELQEDVTEDSVSSHGSHGRHVLLANGNTQGLLEIVQEAAPRAASPARSIPESVYDTTAESQSQRREIAVPARVEYPARIEVIDSSWPTNTEVPHVDSDVAQPTESRVTAHKESQQRDLAAEEHSAPPSPAEVPQSVELPPSSQPRANPEAGLTEHSVSVSDHDAAQFPFHSQRPLCDFPISVQLLESEPSQKETTTLPASAPSTTQPDIVAQPLETASNGTSAASLTQASPANAPQVSQSTGTLGTTDHEYAALLYEFLEPEFAQQTEAEVETVVQSTYASHAIEEEAVRSLDFAFHSQPPRSTDQSTASREQNAQVVHPNDLSTQEDILESIRPSIEKTDVAAAPESPESRHDSSQDSPQRRLSSVGHSSSPILQPPCHSLAELDSHVPPRPATPVPTSSLSIMATQGTGEEMERRIAESLAKRLAEKPYVSRRRMRRSDGSVTTPTGTPTSSVPRPAASPLAGLAEGTRSPSTVPERSPAPPAPTSLRTVALSRASQAAREEPPKEVVEVLPLEIAEIPAPVVPAIIRTEPTAPDQVSSDVEELSDATADDADDDDDTASLLNDELQLAVEEHIVPLFIEGRQSDEYSAHIKKNKDLLQAFMTDPQSYEPLSKVDELLSYLRAIETHMDLVFSEADLKLDDVMDSGTQIDFALQFGIENSTKFRFLHTLFYAMRDQRKHILLVLEQDNDMLFNVIETFCKANFIRYRMPTKGRQADPARIEGSLSITILPSNMSPIIQPADAIICLDGVQDAKQIRQKNWASNPDLEVVPVLHLVISRTVGHIERYLSASLGQRERIHTILASLANMLDDLGKPIDEDMLRAPAAAEHVAEWFQSDQSDRGVWPLGSIGSVKDVIEYQTQMSQDSDVSPVQERAKRPHDDDELDTAKRMRFTPQPQAVPNSSITENEITRISDSMPGTAANDAVTLRAQLAQIEEAYDKERAARKAEIARSREQEVAWDKQQTNYEDLTREYRLLLGKQQNTEEKLQISEKSKATFSERLMAREKEKRELAEELNAQRQVHLLSEDEQTVEITRLRTALALATADKDRAIKSEKTAEQTLEYIRDQYRTAQTAAATSTSAVADLEAQNAKLSHAASGQPMKLKALHLDAQYKQLETQVRSLKAENGILKKSLAGKEEELARAKLSGGRMGVGTRATSATPQPSKVRSRAASPMGGRLSNLRNG
jgi:hypothetical protein